MSEERLGTWRVLSSSYPVTTPFLRLRSDRVELPSGTVIDEYYVRESNGFSVVFAITPERRVVLVRQYKHGIGEIVLELPAGGIEPGETPAACAIRELAEETGYTGAPPEHIRTFITDPTNSNGRFHLYLVREARLTLAPDLDPTEEIEVRTATLDDVRAMVFDGRISSGSQVASVLVALETLRN